MSDFTQNDLDTVNEAIASGALRVSYSNPRREVEYRSIDDLLRARDIIRQSLGKDDPEDRVSIAEFHKGT